jgi:hypothetical protein
LYHTIVSHFPAGLIAAEVHRLADITKPMGISANDLRAWKKAGKLALMDGTQKIIVASLAMFIAQQKSQAETEAEKTEAEAAEMQMQNGIREFDDGILQILK